MPDFVAASVLEFADGTALVMPLHSGTREECVQMLELIPAVSYSGDKTVTKSWGAVFSAEEWEAMND
jgi:hypothetical protein